MILVGCAGLQTKGANLTSEYYQTYEGKTEQIYPEADWAFVNHNNDGTVDPARVKLKYIWVGYDNNVLGLHYYDALEEYDDSCGLFSFVDVQPISGPDWKEMDIKAIQMVPCEEMDSVLAQQLNEGE